MIRTAIILAVSLIGLSPAAAQSAPTRLKGAVTVTSDIVRIGDLVENAGLAANTAIFRSPDLGQTGAVSARAVLDAVRPYGLIGVDVRGISEVSVTRASRTIATEEIETDTWEELGDKLKAPAAKKDAKDAAQRLRVLNHLGRQGWELVGRDKGDVAAITVWTFKRRLPG